MTYRELTEIAEGIKAKNPSMATLHDHVRELQQWASVYNWASTKKPETHVGWTRSIKSCPFANYFKQVDHQKYQVTIHATTLIQGTQEIQVSNPEWIQQAASSVDDLYDKNDETDRPVTASEFIAILEEVKFLLPSS